MRHAALDAREFIERDLRVFDVLVRGRILAHLLHQTLCRGNWISDFVREGRGQFIERGLLLGAQLFLLLQHFAIYFARDCRFEYPLMHPSPSVHRREMARDSKSPSERRPNEPWI